MPALFSLARSIAAAVIAINLTLGCNAPYQRRSDPVPAGPRNETEEASPPVRTSAQRSRDEVFICGGTTTRSVVDRWFVDLETALAATGSDHLYDNLVRRQFSIREAQGAVHRYDTASVDAVTPDIISRDEWRQIHLKGPDQLKDAGWRGCFLDDGKVWFEASEENGFRLTAIARDMPWNRATGG